MSLFKTHSPYSWRKILTALCGLLFAFSVVGHQLFKLPELPASYTGILFLVISFYFFRTDRKPKPDEQN